MIPCNAKVWRRVFVQEPCQREATEPDGLCIKHTKTAMADRAQKRQDELRRYQELVKTACEEVQITTPKTEFVLNAMARFVDAELAKANPDELADD